MGASGDRITCYRNSIILAMDFTGNMQSILTASLILSVPWACPANALLNEKTFPSSKKEGRPEKSGRPWHILILMAQSSTTIRNPTS
jgi:hypothetical protein